MPCFSGTLTPKIGSEKIFFTNKKFEVFWILWFVAAIAIAALNSKNAKLLAWNALFLYLIFTTSSFMPIFFFLSENFFPLFSSELISSFPITGSRFQKKKDLWMNSFPSNSFLNYTTFPFFLSLSLSFFCRRGK